MTLANPVTAEELAEQFRSSTPPGLGDDWPNRADVIAAHRQLSREAIAKVGPPPVDDILRGIVICAGGHRLFTNAWVCVRMLRHWGCTLPIQLWYLGEHELDEQMREIMAPYNVSCVDAQEVASRHQPRILNGWELKPFAILYCPFRQVMLLDADNVPIADPSYLFDLPEFQEHGAIFWPDFSRLEPFRSIWQICEVEYRDEPEFESGQVMVDKPRCWVALNLAMHYNEHSDFYYQHIHGDKETFHLAFHRVSKSYAMPSRGIHALDATMCQHDFGGTRVFQHRNMDKWRYDGGNRRIYGFEHEDLCREFLAELRQRWSGIVHWNATPTPIEQAMIFGIGNRCYQYERVGYDTRPLELRADRTIGLGCERCERTWTIRVVEGTPSLFIFGEEGATCRMQADGNSWRGRWYHYEKMPVILQHV